MEENIRPYVRPFLRSRLTVLERTCKRLGKASGIPGRASEETRAEGWKDSPIFCRTSAPVGAVTQTGVRRDEWMDERRYKRIDRRTPRLTREGGQT